MNSADRVVTHRSKPLASSLSALSYGYSFPIYTMSATDSALEGRCVARVYSRGCGLVATRAPSRQRAPVCQFATAGARLLLHGRAEPPWCHADFCFAPR